MEAGKYYYTKEVGVVRCTEVFSDAARIENDVCSVYVKLNGEYHNRDYNNYDCIYECNDKGEQIEYTIVENQQFRTEDVDHADDVDCKNCDIFVLGLSSCPRNSSGNLACTSQQIVFKSVDDNVKKKNTKPDLIVEELRSLLLQRSETGIKKYNTTLDRTDLVPSEWCQHALEEALDFAGYILRLKKDLEKLEQVVRGSK